MLTTKVLIVLWVASIALGDESQWEMIERMVYDHTFEQYDRDLVHRSPDKTDEKKQTDQTDETDKTDQTDQPTDEKTKQMDKKPLTKKPKVIDELTKLLKELAEEEDGWEASELGAVIAAGISAIATIAGLVYKVYLKFRIFRENNPEFAYGQFFRDCGSTFARILCRKRPTVGSLIDLRSIQVDPNTVPKRVARETWI